MTNEKALLDRYHQLVKSHDEQFQPSLQQLEQQIRSEINRLQSAETSLIEEQMQTLTALKEAIETDAKFVLKLPEFQAFMDSLPRDRTSQRSQQVSEWSLNHDDQILQVSQYKPVFEPDDYDDEQTHASYGYSVAVQWGAENVKMEHIVTRRVYGINHSRSYSQSDEVEMIGSWVDDLFPSYPSTSEEQLLLEEMSHLVAYCCSLLALSPQKVAFQYSSTEAEH
jgi:hypothetical protein